MKNMDLAQKSAKNGDSPAGEPPVRAANEDSPTGGALYRLISRRPSTRIPAAATIGTIFSIAAGAAYVWGYYGPKGIDSLTRPEILLVVGGMLVPVVLVWLAAWTVWRGQEMKLMAEALARTAIRLTDPADPASDEIVTIAETVRNELGLLKASLAEALAETTRLKSLVGEELEEIDRSTSRAEARTMHMDELLNQHRDSMIEIGRRLGTESDTISRGLRQQVDAVRGLIGEAESTLQEAGARIASETESLARVSEAARAGADATASTLDRQASRLEVVAANALGKADQLGARYETQRQIIADAANRLDEERQRLETVFDANRDGMAAAASLMSERTAEISKAAAELTASLNATFDGAAKRAATVRAEISGEVSRAVADVDEASGAISRSAGAATRAIGATIEELRTATSALSDDLTRAATDTIATTAGELRHATATMIEEVSRATSTLSSDVAARANELRRLADEASSENDAAAERFNTAMIRLGGAAKDAGHALQDAASDLETRIARMPNDAAASAASLNHVLQEQVAALAAIADIVVRHARVLDRAAPPLAASIPPAPPPRPIETPRADQARRWGISDLLAAAGRDVPPPPARENAETASDSEFHRSSLQVIETLQALSIDLDRALEQSPPPDLWQRYQAGERNVFARRLYSMAGRQLYDRIAVNYRNEPEFREHVDRFVELFERLLNTAAQRDRDNILVETYLSSDTGKVYLMLAQASGKLA